jgi:hypothetical protein
VHQVCSIPESRGSKSTGGLAKMDEQESTELTVGLDWESIEKQIDEYDAGNITAASLQAKMLEAAFNDGYAFCMAEQEEAQANLLIMLSVPSGNA